MSGRDIPGYYYDVEKNKYFKIQPGHKLPAHSKYASSNVQKETRARERQQRDVQQHKQLLAGRPSLAAALKFGSMPGAILSRELGHKPEQRALVESSCALASTLTCSRPLRCSIPRATHGELTGAYPMPSTNYLLLEFRHNTFAEAQWDHLNMGQRLTLHTNRLFHSRNIREQHYHQYHRGTNQLQYLSLTPIGQTVDYHYCMPSPHCHHGFDSCQATTGTIQTDEMLTLMDVRVRDRDRIAIATLDQLVCLDVLSGAIQALRLKKEVRCIDWLGHNVLAAGQGKGVRLWDVRTRDSLTRLQHKKRVTGMIGDRGMQEHQLLVSDNYGIKLYDLRMTSHTHDLFPLEFQGVHEGPRALMDVGPAGLVATLTDGCLRILSLTYGRRVTSYELPGPQSQLPTQLAWHEDARGGPYVQLCHAHSLWRWSLDEINVAAE